MNSVDEVEPVPAAEPHHVTFFAPDRPVGGTTVYVVACRNDAADTVDPDGLLPR